MIYQNYHKHTMYSNVRVPDSVASYEQYALKAKEYGHGILSSVEHGWQGRYIETYEVAKAQGLKFLFGTETYFVFDRKLKDATNAHMIICAKNERGRKAINEALSEANMTGFYYQPRVDLELMLKLPPEDVWVTTACLAGPLKYTQERWDKLIRDIPELVKKFDLLEEPYIYLIKKLHKHFGNNFFLEVQAHHTVIQIDVNTTLKDLSSKLGIQLIAGVDSHYISNDRAWERDEYLASRGLHYEDEDGWFMDYPDGQTLFKRFQEQGVFSDEEIKGAMAATNIFLTVEDYVNPIFEQNVKMPILPKYNHLNQEQRDEVFTKLVWQKWEEEKEFIPANMIDTYEKEIAKEIDVVVPTGLADYFLLDYELIKLGKEKGGRLTYTGRGSAPSFYLTKLLGLTNIDRISSPVKLYPERFISKTRILESKSLPDIDLNCGNTDPFIEAQDELLGKGHSYPMIAFGTYQIKSAWKLFAKSQDISFDLANAVAAQIGQYLEDLKNADEDKREDVSVEDYIDEEYQEIFEKSKVYRDIVASISIHPCAQIVYQENIASEIGLMQVNAHLCAIMDGAWAETYKFLKNDLLTVSVVEFIGKTFDRIGIPQLTVRELLAICTPTHPCWDIYKNAWTVGINQCEQSGSAHKVALYKPTNISELAAFVAAIRPGFKSMYSTFEKRKSFTYGIATIDALIQTEQFPQSFMLYQEQAMLLLNYSGIPLDETYSIIKAISKKNPEKVQQYKRIFLSGMAKKITETEHESMTKAKAVAQQVWQIISDSQRYSFNSSHALAVAMDSLYGAYLKTTYPLAFYETYLRVMEENSKKDKMLAAQREAIEAYGIRFDPMKFGQDNRQIICHSEDNSITSSIQSLKGFSRRISYSLYTMKDFAFNNFIDLLYYVKEKTPINSAQMEILIALNYFEQFGGNLKLQKIYELFLKLYDPDKKKKDLSSRVIGKLQIPEEFLINACERTETKEKEHFYILDKNEFIQFEGERVSNSYGFDLFQAKNDKKWDICDIATGVVLFSTATKTKKKDVNSYIEENNIINKWNYKIKMQKNKKLVNPKVALPPEDTKYVETRYFNTDLGQLLGLCENAATDEILSIREQFTKELEYLSYISMTYPFLPKRYCFVEDIDTKFKPRVNIYCLKTGKRLEVRIPIKIFNRNKIKKSELISADTFSKTPAWNPPDANGNFTEKKGVYEWSLLEYFKIDDLKLQKIIDDALERNANEK